MKNTSLVKDYLDRASARLKAIDVLMQERSFADVVRESQEVIELSLKALLRFSQIAVPRIHDVSPVLKENLDRLPAKVRNHVDRLSKISRSLRRDRELAFYGSEDLTPSEFYQAEDATEAFESAKWVVGLIREVCLG
ncbi:MAG: HEPN domain-containing protein [Deltaproteobacteria bacterium]|nr:HEPN domain-containing protein [Deltaproteobacteria bacterium]